MNILNHHKEMSLFEFTEGIDIDSRLFKEELQAQMAWAKGLTEMNVLNQTDFIQLESVLKTAGELIENKSFPWKKEDEDIHMNLERFVTENLGDIGKKMHLGRSRNDLIATTLKLFVTNTLNQTGENLKTFIESLEFKASKYFEVIIPGMTHLQNAQPMRLSHFFNGHAHAFKRDTEQIEWLKDRTKKIMPAGSGALAGTGIEIDLDLMKEMLGFEQLPQSSFDEVGSRDFILEALECYSHIAIHLSRLAEDLIYWSSSNVGLIKLPKELSTGSSIMPNKRNPDVLELTRARSSHVISAVSNAQLLLKALPTTYNSDLHEMKGIYLKSFDLINSLLQMNQQFIKLIEADQTKATVLLNNGHLLATEIADFLTTNNVPFREAYQIVTELVALAEGLKIQVHQLPLSVLEKAHPSLKGVGPWLSFEHACNRKKYSGGTSYLKLT